MARLHKAGAVKAPVKKVAAKDIISAADLKFIKVETSRINGLWMKAASALIEVGQALVAAYERLANEEGPAYRAEPWEAFIKELTFDERKVQKLMKIAKRSLIVNNVAKLPPSFTTLDTLARIKDGPLKKLFAQGDVHPNMIGSDAEELVIKVNGKPEKAAKVKDDEDDNEGEEDDESEEEVAPKRDEVMKEGRVRNSPKPGEEESTTDNLDILQENIVNAIEGVEFWIERLEARLGSDGAVQTTVSTSVEEALLGFMEKLETFISERTA